MNKTKNNKYQSISASMNIHKYLLLSTVSLVIFFGLVRSLEVRAADIVAAGCDPTSIQNALNAASNGDTVWFPYETCSATWTSGITMSKVGVTLSGRNGTGCPTNCVDNTVIRVNGGTLTMAADNTRITGITFANAISTAISVSGANRHNQSSIRIDHNKFTNGVGTTSITVGPVGHVVIGPPDTGGADKITTGVIDHNLFTGPTMWKAVDVAGDSFNSWSRPATLGTANSMFLEDNKFDYTKMIISGVAVTDCGYGGDIVLRYNTFHNAWPDHHGGNETNPTGWAGTHTTEVYNNIFLNDSINSWIASNQRSGTGVWYDNTFTTSGSGVYGSLMMFENYRGDVSPNCTSSTGCNGNYRKTDIPYDQNTPGQAGYLCWEQPGSSIVDGTTLVSNPIYEWNNTWNAKACASYSDATHAICVTWMKQCGYQHVQLGRDVIANGTTPKPGYTAYTYPHPLVSGSLVTHTVTPSAGPNGTISPSTSQTVSNGSTIQFNVTPNTGYSASVGGTCGGSLAGTIYTTNAITANCTVSVTFNSGYTLTVAKSGTGLGTVTGTGIDCGSDCAETINTGTSVTLTASPDSDSVFSGWSGGGCSGTGACTVTMNSNITVTATFNQPGSPVNLLINGDFESGFTSGLANGWQMTTDGNVTYSVSQDTGHQGSGQKITVTTPGSWGLLFYQNPAFQLNQSYTWSFWYKTQGGDLWAQITDPPRTEAVFEKQLPDTNGEWQQAAYTFQYTNSQATQLRFSSNTAGTYWLDDIHLVVGADSIPPAAPTGLVVQ